MHLDTQTLIALGVGIHLLTSLARSLFKLPKQQAQINAIESKVDDVLTHVVQYLPAATTPAPTQPTSAQGGAN